jgi:hypothetical protein
MSSGCNTSLSLFYLNHPPTAIGRFLAYPSDENFPEKFKSENFPPHITDGTALAFIQGKLLATNHELRLNGFEVKNRT